MLIPLYVRQLWNSNPAALSMSQMFASLYVWNLIQCGGSGEVQNKSELVSWETEVQPVQVSILQNTHKLS